MAELVQLFKACDISEKACRQANADKDKVIVGQKALIDSQTKQLETIKASDSSIMNNKALWFVLGVLFTGATVYLVKPH